MPEGALPPAIKTTNSLGVGPHGRGVGVLVGVFAGVIVGVGVGVLVAVFVGVLVGVGVAQPPLLSRTRTLFPARSATARSGLPSPLRSLTAAEIGALPAAKLTAV